MLILQRNLYTKILCFIVFFLCENSLILHAQTEWVVSILPDSISSGGSFTLVQDGDARTRYTSSNMPLEGIKLKNASTIYTTAGTFVEARAMSGNTLIRIAENSMLSFDDVSGSNSSIIITLMYGRIRVDQESKTEAETKTIIVNSGASITEIQNGSINLDYIVSPALKYKSQPVLSVSTISGRAIVVPSNTKQARINMKQKETLTVDPQNGKTKRRFMSKSVPAYWLNINTSSPVRSPAESNNAVSSSLQPISFENLTPLEESTVLKTNGIIVGLGILLIGVTAQTVGHYLYKDVDQVFYAGYVPIGIGSFTLIASYFYPTYVNAMQLKAAGIK